ncbi:hypothetical protein F5Y11DRAFT_337183 [Daldinia sp. FL1419]|nr:hypothetical protein F5Y11DRAFT_337183 [Daldinia sp. FL1419]
MISLAEPHHVHVDYAGIYTLRQPGQPDEGFQPAPGHGLWVVKEMRSRRNASSSSSYAGACTGRDVSLYVRTPFHNFKMPKELVRYMGPNGDLIRYGIGHYYETDISCLKTFFFFFLPRPRPCLGCAASAPLNSLCLRIAHPSEVNSAIEHRSYDRRVAGDRYRMRADKAVELTGQLRLHRLGFVRLHLEVTRRLGLKSDPRWRNIMEHLTLLETREVVYCGYILHRQLIACS